MATKKGSGVEKSEDLVQEVNLGEVVHAEDPVKEVILFFVCFVFVFIRALTLLTILRQQY